MLTYLCPDLPVQGQESRKVADLAEAMREAGLDPDAITDPIDDEYAAMDLPE